MCERICDDVDMRKVKNKLNVTGFDVVYKYKYVLSRCKLGGLAIAMRQFMFQVEVDTKFL